ncbi:glutaredoxin [Rhodanobacter sp. OR444]|uniref:glutaredoxin n=1 Tax=Rhodanobacter sp. OR444 TaxID=1076525 RepID=UPI0021017A47|nr:glutaredoxin [Rhodanobacter sp. OR444]
MTAGAAKPGCGGSTVAARGALAIWHKLQIMPESPHRHIVIYQSAYCPACRRVAAELIDLCRQFDADTEVRDVLEHLEQAARLGITRPPAIVIKGHLFGQGNTVLGKLRRKELA